MRKLLSTLFIASAITLSASADDAVKAKLHADKPGAKINREIYGPASMADSGWAKTHPSPTSKAIARTSSKP